MYYPLLAATAYLPAPHPADLDDEPVEFGLILHQPLIQGTHLGKGIVQRGALSLQPVQFQLQLHPAQLSLDQNETGVEGGLGEVLKASLGSPTATCLSRKNSSCQIPSLAPLTELTLRLLVSFQQRSCHS